MHSAARFALQSGGGFSTPLQGYGGGPGSGSHVRARTGHCGGFATPPRMPGFTPLRSVPQADGPPPSAQEQREELRQLEERCEVMDRAARIRLLKTRLEEGPSSFDSRAAQVNSNTLARLANFGLGRHGGGDFSPPVKPGRSAQGGMRRRQEVAFGRSKLVCLL